MEELVLVDAEELILLHAKEVVLLDAWEAVLLDHNEFGRLRPIKSTAAPVYYTADDSANAYSTHFIRRKLTDGQRYSRNWRTEEQRNWSTKDWRDEIDALKTDKIDMRKNNEIEARKINEIDARNWPNIQFLELKQHRTRV